MQQGQLCVQVIHHPPQPLQKVFSFWLGVAEVLVKICVETPVLPDDVAPLWEDGLQLIIPSSNQRLFLPQTTSRPKFTQEQRRINTSKQIFFPSKSLVV